MTVDNGEEDVRHTNTHTNKHIYIYTKANKWNFTVGALKQDREKETRKK